MAATEAATPRVPPQIARELSELVVLSRADETGRQYKARPIGGHCEQRLPRGARKQRCPRMLEAALYPDRVAAARGAAAQPAIAAHSRADVNVSKPHPHPSMSRASRRRCRYIQRRASDCETGTGRWDGTADGTAPGLSLLPSARRRRRPGEGHRSTSLAPAFDLVRRHGVAASPPSATAVRDRVRLTGVPFTACSAAATCR
jgi:hypothetical protein